MTGRIFLSTAYLPPVEYFVRIKEADGVLIEHEENYLKQSYRNRCYILSVNKPQILTVPVYLGSFHKTKVSDIRIDHSKRWQQVHLGALTSAYSSSPFFLYYFEVIEKIILSDHEFLLDLNMDLLAAIMKMMKMEIKISYTNVFRPVENDTCDYRYSISPKKASTYSQKEYIQVFNSDKGFMAGLSIADLLFNMGPEAEQYI